MNIDVIVVGAGCAGITCARQLAELGKRVLIIEQRNHIGGNAYDYNNSDGILVHKYGPHIFHTNNNLVFNWLLRFTDWHNYEHKVIANIPYKKKRLNYSIPFNFGSIKNLFGEHLIQILQNEYPFLNQITLSDLKQSQNAQLYTLALQIEQFVFKFYSIKQWGCSYDKISINTINRVPIYLSYEDKYFLDKIQGLPKNGYTEMFKNMLNHPNITIKLNTKFSIKNNALPIIYTGAIDELFEYCFGKLPYRSINFIFNTYNQETIQNYYGTVNYPLDKVYTRITEFKNLTGQKNDKTTIVKEYPCEYNGTNLPLYPINTELNNSLYQKYKELANSFSNLYLVGRLAEYKYYNMDTVFNNSLELIKNIKF